MRFPKLVNENALVKPQTPNYPSKKEIAETLSVWVLGISLSAGGCFCNWNEGLSSGFGNFLIALVVVASAYIMTALCTSEVSSAFPFAGGCFGLARCTVGYYGGFLAAILQISQYICLSSVLFVEFGRIASDLQPGVRPWQPLVWLGLYLFAWTFHVLSSSRVFWLWNLAFAMLSVLLVCVFCLGSLQWVDLGEYGKLSSVPCDSNNNSSSSSEGGGLGGEGGGVWFDNGVSGFMYALPLCCWFFVGSQSLNMSCDDVDSPKRSIPAGQRVVVLTLVGMALFVFIVWASLPPGLRSTLALPAPLGKGTVCCYGLGGLGDGSCH